MCQIDLLNILRNREEMSRGLMWRKCIPENTGMLFVYEKPQKLSFWMKNTFIPLDLAYIGPDMCVNEIRSLEPFSLKSVKSKEASIIALEVNQGTLKKLGVDIGDRVTISKESKTLIFHNRDGRPE
jgi:uncharacterized protein